MKQKEEKIENKETKIEENSVDGTEKQQKIEEAKEELRKDLLEGAEDLAKENNINLDSVTDGKKSWVRCDKRECRERDKKLVKFDDLQNLFAGEYERRMFLLKENMRLVIQLYGPDIIRTLIQICGDEAKEATENEKKPEQDANEVADKDKENMLEIVLRISEGMDYKNFARFHNKEIKLDDIEVDYDPAKDEYTFSLPNNNLGKLVVKGSGKFMDVVYLEMFVNGELKEKKKIRGQMTQINAKEDSSEQKKEGEEKETN